MSHRTGAPGDPLLDSPCLNGLLDCPESVEGLKGLVCVRYLTQEVEGIDYFVAIAHNLTKC